MILFSFFVWKDYKVSLVWMLISREYTWIFVRVNVIHPFLTISLLFSCFLLVNYIVSFHMSQFLWAFLIACCELKAFSYKSIFYDEAWTKFSFSKFFFFVFHFLFTLCIYLLLYRFLNNEKKCNQFSDLNVSHSARVL